MLSQILVKPLLVVNYHLNKTEIARKYCENKAKPKMHCDGKCHLMKQLKKEEKKEPSPFSKDTKDKFEPQFFKENIYNFRSNVITFLNHQTEYSFSISSFLPKGVFHPPNC